MNETNPDQTDQTTDAPKKKHWTPKRVAFWVFNVALVGVAGYYIVQEFAQHWGELRNYELSLSWGPVFWSLFWFTLANVGLAQSYRLTLALFGQSLNFPEAFQVWMMAVPFKYVPGKVGIIAGRIVLHDQFGVPRGHAVAAYLMEGFFLLFTGLGMGLLSMAWWSETMFWRPFLLGSGFFFGGLVAMHPAVVHRLLAFALKKFKQAEALPPVNMAQVYTIYVWFAGLWLIKGISTSYMTKALYPESALGIMESISFFSLALMGGSLTILPGGLGVQEAIAIQVVEQASSIPEAPLVLSVAFRLYMVIGELIMAAVGAYWFAHNTGGIKALRERWQAFVKTEHELEEIQDQD